MKMHRLLGLGYLTPYILGLLVFTGDPVRRVALPKLHRLRPDERADVGRGLRTTSGSSRAIAPSSSR